MPHDLSQDICLEFYSGSVLQFHFWIHCDFINSSGMMKFGISDLDKDNMSNYSKGFAIEIEFKEANESIEQMVEDSHKLFYDPLFNDY